MIKKIKKEKKSKTNREMSYKLKKLAESMAGN
jgi:hypothetical protein